MSIKAYNWAWFEIPPRVLKDGERIVLLALADHTGPDGLCRPAWPRIATMCDCSETTVWRRLKRLQEAGLVTIVEHGSRKGKANRSNVYRLNMTAPREHRPFTDLEYETLNGLTDPLQSATGGYPQPLAPDATGDQLQIAMGATEGGSQIARGPIAELREGPPRAATRPQPLLNRQEPSRARAREGCGRPHYDHVGELVPCHQFDECLHRLDDRDIATGRRGIALVREAIAQMRPWTEAVKTGSDGDGAR